MSIQILRKMHKFLRREVPVVRRKAQELLLNMIPIISKNINVLLENVLSLLRLLLFHSFKLTILKSRKKKFLKIRE